MKQPYESIKLSRMRMVIARRLTEAKQTVPHFYVTSSVRIDQLEALRHSLNAADQGQRVRLTVTDFLIRALGIALTKVPQANVQYANTELHRFCRSDISVAVALDDGIVTPVLCGVETRSLVAIATEFRDLCLRVRTGRLLESERVGGSATISNLGMFGVDHFEAILNPPQAIILAVGAATKQALVSDDKVVVGTLVNLCGSFDHRAIDGVVAAKLMSTLKELIEAPATILF